MNSRVNHSHSSKVLTNNGIEKDPLSIPAGKEWKEQKWGNILTFPCVEDEAMSTRGILRRKGYDNNLIASKLFYMCESNRFAEKSITKYATLDP